MHVFVTMPREFVINFLAIGSGAGRPSAECPTLNTSELLSPIALTRDHSTDTMRHPRSDSSPACIDETPIDRTHPTAVTGCGMITSHKKTDE